MEFLWNSIGIPTKFISDRLSESRRAGLEPDYNLDSVNYQNSLELPRKKPFGPPEIFFFHFLREGALRAPRTLRLDQNYSTL